MNLHITGTAPGQTPCQANSLIYMSVLSDTGHPQYADAVTAGRIMCKSCPQFAACLRDTLTGPDVDGFVAGTTPAERDRLRDMLKVTKATVNIDGLLGADAREPRAAVDLDVLAATLRRYPTESHREISERLSCSPETVKRRSREALARPVPGSRPNLSPQAAVTAYAQVVPAF